MSKQIALIVDDSKTAQIRLRKMLDKYDIEVDTTLSAEEALTYLTQKIPAVVFMDHHMEGMDGLEALKIIKANPKTAMIPVIMYTSEKGEVYIGQARALGALDILSKEIIKAESLHRVLNRLNIKLKQALDQSASEPPTHRVSKKSTGSPKKSTATKPAPSQEYDLRQLKIQLINLIERHSSDIRQQLEDHYRSINKRLASRQEDITVPVEDENKAGKIYHIEQPQRESGFSRMLLFALVIGMGFLGYELTQTRQEIASIDNNYAKLLASSRAQNQLITELRAADAVTNPVEIGTIEIGSSANPNPGSAPLRALDWTFNDQLNFDYNQPPLGETQMSQINNLVYMLDSIGFTGEVNLEVHFGNLCLQGTSNGEWRPASSDLPIAQCIMYKDIVPAFTAESLITRPYLSLTQTAVPIIEGRMVTEVFSRGFESPQHTYPEQQGNATAADWNRVALQNNRVTVLLKGR